MKKHLLMYVVLLSAVVITGCNQPKNSDDSSLNSSVEKVEVTGITINSNDNIRTIKVDETLQLTAVVYPLEASQEISWSSSNNEVASVNENGLVSALSSGMVSIIATSKENTSVTQSFALVIEDKDVVVIQPSSVTLTSENNVTTCKVGNSLTLNAIVYPVEASQSVIWESSDETKAVVKRGVVSALSEGEVTITVKVKDFEDIKESITLTIEASDDPIYNTNWSEMDYTTHEVFMECDNETPLKVKGVVTHVTPVSDGNVSYYLQNGTDGYYVYGQNSLTYPVELGQCYEVGGYKKYYRGANEIVDVEYFKECTEPLTYVVNDISQKDPSSTQEMSMYHASYVSANAIIKSVPSMNGKAYSVNVNINNHDSVLRVDPSMMTTEEFNLINTSFAKTIVGQEVEFKGIMTAFGYGAPSNQIQIVKSTDLVFDEISAVDLVNAAKGALTIQSSIATSVSNITLPSFVEGFEDVSVTWESDNPIVNVETGAVIHNEDDTIVTLTATLSYKDVSESKSYLINVFGNASYEVVASLDLDDAAPANNYGNSETQPSYAQGVVNLGTPKANWLLRNALISSTDSDRYEGVFSIRAQASSTHDATGRIEIQQDGEYNYVQFSAAVYGNDSLGIQLGVEYSLDSGTNWLDSNMIVSVTSREFEVFRFSLPKGEKRVAIYILENSGKRVNIDNIQLLK